MKWCWGTICAPPGGYQSPESPAEWSPGGSPEAAAVGPVGLHLPRGAASHHHFLQHHLVFFLPITALGVPAGLPWRRDGSQWCHLVAAGDQPPVDRSHASGGRGVSLEENVSGRKDFLLLILAEQVVFDSLSWGIEYVEVITYHRLPDVFLLHFYFRHQQLQDLAMVTRVRLTNCKEL